MPETTLTLASGHTIRIRVARDLLIPHGLRIDLEVSADFPATIHAGGNGTTHWAHAMFYQGSETMVPAVVSAILTLLVDIQTRA